MYWYSNNSNKLETDHMHTPCSLELKPSIHQLKNIYLQTTVWPNGASPWAETLHLCSNGLSVFQKKACLVIKGRGDI